MEEGEGGGGRRGREAGGGEKGKRELAVQVLPRVAKILEWSIREVEPLYRISPKDICELSPNSQKWGGE